MFEHKDKGDAFISTWNVLMYPSNEDEYVHHLSSIEIDYQPYLRVVNYVRDAWLNPSKERFVATWTDRIMHFGNLTKK